eukprot:NODE_24888_length_607_cov_1.504167.p3 GENE.NODE_24888_length_607_cov_1.504167~~NODE_24888_length_607_cov_1.504167.p3  ORF type:complete len:56 (+),score=12.23 NODE_24888_length_607_cov_1.504167:341-508(+)
MASASIALASSMICWMRPMTPPLAACFLYSLKSGGGAGPAGSCLCTKSAASAFLP